MHAGDGAATELGTEPRRDKEENGEAQTWQDSEESIGSSYFLCVQEWGYTYTRELYPLYPNVRNVLNVAVVRVQVYPDNVTDVPRRSKCRCRPGTRVPV